MKPTSSAILLAVLGLSVLLPSGTVRAGDDSPVLFGRVKSAEQFLKDRRLELSLVEQKLRTARQASPPDAAQIKSLAARRHELSVRIERLDAIFDEAQGLGKEAQAHVYIAARKGHESCPLEGSGTTGEQRVPPANVRDLRPPAVSSDLQGWVDQITRHDTVGYNTEAP